MNLTSDLITGIDIESSISAFGGDLNVNLLRVSTQTGMSLIVDYARFSKLKIGDQINLSIEVIER